MHKEGVTVSMLKPCEIAFLGAESVFDFPDIRSRLNNSFSADGTGKGDLGSSSDSFMCVNPGLHKGFVDSLPGDVVFSGEFFHGDKIGGVGLYCFGLFLAGQMVESGRVFHVFILLVYFV